MSADYITSLPLTKWLLENYDSNHSTRFPGGSKVHYNEVLLSTHKYLNEQVHSTLQNRAPLHDSGVYLTDHGPKHIELVLRRASQLVRSEACVRSQSTRNPYYEPCLDPYEAFLLALAIHFHDVGNMYGRVGHEQEIAKIMDGIGALQPLGFAEKHLIARIAMCHGGKIEGDKNTIRTLPAGEQHDGEVRYRPQLLAAILRFADELADEHSRADNFGLIKPDELPPTCLLFHKYAAALQVSMDALGSQIILKFSLRAEE